MSKSEHPIGAKEEVSGKVQKASTYKCLKIEYEWCETKGLGKLSKAMRQGMVACSVASAHNSLGHAQPLEHGGHYPVAGPVPQLAKRMRGPGQPRQLGIRLRLR